MQVGMGRSQWGMGIPPYALSRRGPSPTPTRSGLKKPTFCEISMRNS